MAERGYFYLQTNLVQRSKGQSAVAAAAYQSGQSLTQAEELHHQRVRDDETQALSQRPSQLDIAHSRTLNKGHLDPALRDDLAELGVHLSEECTVERLGRREWRVTDDHQSIRFKYSDRRAKDPETGKRRVVDAWLNLYCRKHHNYANKNKEEVKTTWLQAPDSAPAWLRDAIGESPQPSPDTRLQLWNLAEDSERYRNGLPARRFQLSLSRHLSYDQNLATVRRFVDEELIAHGYAADIAIHQVKASDGQPNLHAHILTTTRTLRPDGTLNPEKDRNWLKKVKLYEWRDSWAIIVNEALEDAGSDTRIDPRSYQERGIKRKPREHLSKRELAQERKGYRTQKGNHNRKIDHHNQILALLAGEEEMQIEQQRSHLDDVTAPAVARTSGALSQSIHTENTRLDTVSGGSKISALASRWYHQIGEVRRFLSDSNAVAFPKHSGYNLWGAVRETTQYLVDKARKLKQSLGRSANREQQRASGYER